MATVNQVTYFTDDALLAVRTVEAPAADWTGGGNLAASNANYVGPNTGNYGPTEENFPQDAERFGIGQTIAGNTSTVKSIDPTFGDEARIGFLETTGVVAADALVGDISAVNFFNRTGAEIPSGEWVWAVADEA